MTEESSDRRSAVRRQAVLPFAWVETAAEVSLTEACARLGVSAAAALQARLAELDEELKRVSASVADQQTSHALQLLDRKVDVLAETALSDLPVPEPRPLILSADGIGFDSADALPPDTWLALHIVLPVSGHLVCRARVSRCSPLPEGHRVGATFVGLDAATARRLTRFSIGRDRSDAEPPSPRR